MFIRKTMMCLFVIAALLSGAAAAQEAADESLIKELMSRIEKLEARVAELEGAQPAGTTERTTEPRPVAPDVKISGESWLVYSFDTDGTNKNDNEFSVGRMYLTLKKKVASNVDFRYTSDVRTSNTYTDTGGDRVSTGRFDLFSKFAYLSFNGVVKNGSLVVGQQATPWTGFEDEFWRYRPVSKAMSDRLGYADSSDFGVSLAGSLGGGGLTEYHLMLANGEGYGAGEETGNKNGKDLMLRVSRPIAPELPVVGLYFESGSSGNDDSDRIGALIGKTTDNYHYGFNYIKGEDGATDSRAYSLYGGTAIGGTRWACFARYDNYDPDTDVSGNLRKFTILGLSYKINPATKLYISRIEQKIQNGTDDADITATLHLKY